MATADIKQTTSPYLRIAHDLDWYFNDAASELGQSSNWDAMVSAAISPGSRYADPFSDARIRAVDRKRQIERTYFDLSLPHQNVLFANHGAIHLPHALSAVLSDLAPSALCLPNEDQSALLKACERHLKALSTPADKILFSQVRIDASQLQQDSYQAYLNTFRTYLAQNKNK